MNEIRLDAQHEICGYSLPTVAAHRCAVNTLGEHFKIGLLELYEHKDNRYIFTHYSMPDL